MCPIMRRPASSCRGSVRFSMTHYSNAPRRQNQERPELPSLSSSSRAINRPRSAMTARPVRARATAGQPKYPAPPGPSSRKLRAPRARPRPMSNQAGASRRATRVRTSRRATDSMKAVSSSPECHSPPGFGLRISARTLGFTIGVGGRRAGSNPATSTRSRRRASSRRAAAIALR